MYNSFEEIQAEKDKLCADIDKKKAEIGKIWNNVFHREETPLYETPTQRILRYANTGAGMFDGALLGWKLYKKLSGSTLFSLGRKRRK